MSETRGIVRVDPSGPLTRGSSRRELLPAVVATVGLVVIGLFVAVTTDTRSFYYPLGLFSYVMGWTGLPLAYPLIAVAVFVLPFSEQIRHRQIAYTRVRANLRHYLLRAALKNAVIAFLVFFSFVFIVFCCIFYALPAMGLTHFDTFAPGSYPQDFQLARMSELLRANPLIYGLVYSAWSGANAAVWASVGLVAILTIRNRFLALAFPLILFIALGFLLAIQGGVFSQVSPWTLWVLFGITQVSMLPAGVTLAIFALLAATGIALVAARANRLSNVQ